MLRILLGVFIMLHGLVHLLYSGHSRRLFELQSGLTWPDGSWTFSGILGDGLTRSLAAIACLIAAGGLVIAGTGILLQQTWGRSVLTIAAAFSALLYLLFWNGKMQALDDQGGIALLINLALLVVAFLIRWPVFEG